ncbi:MAG: DUF4153 domain-containing protein [Bacteroidales bacterium]|nr:DUF4153 domain-containing protein [Bacteroidales bacterium]
MSFLKRFSFADWLKQVGGACRRFPVAVLLLVFLTGYIVLLIQHNGTPADGKWNFFFIFYPATGSLLAISLQLLTEDFKHRAVAIATQVVVHALWLGVSLYLTQFERFSMQQMVGVSATVVSMVLSLFLLCFYRKDDDVPFWNFAQRLFVALVAGIMVGGILTLGIVLFVQSLDWLFGINVDGWFPYIPTFCLVLLAPLLAMSQIPAGKQKRIRHVAPYTGFSKGVVQYLFIPLLLLYMGTLYVYASKILLTWQLPVGWVCYLVSASMLGMVILIFVTYPIQHEQGNSIFKRLTRWLPLAMIPLLVLMSVAIGRRLSDYGITVSRLYVVVFNLWCYAVCIGLLLCRNRRIWWVPASFATLLMLISVGPWSIPNVTEHRLLDEAREAFAASGLKQLPLSGEQYEKWLQSVDEKVAKSIDAKLAYLERDYGYDSTLGLLEKDAVVGIFSTGIDQVVEVSESLQYYNRGENLLRNVGIPQGYSHVSAAGTVNLVDQQDNRLVLEVHSWIGKSMSTYRFEAKLNQFAERDIERSRHNTVEPLILDNGRAALVVDNYSLTLNGASVVHASISGILFTP